MKRMLVVLAIVVMVILSLPLVSFGLNFSSLGTATVDGSMSPGEWDKATKLDFQVNLPSSMGGGTTPATLYVMNNDVDLFFAVKIAQPSFGPKMNFLVDFDNNNNGAADSGEDAVQMYVGDYIKTVFQDMYRYSDATGVANESTTDIDPKGGILPIGSNDGSAAAKNNGSFTVMELSHPLVTTDMKHDFNLKLGNKVGFKATLKILGKNGWTDTIIPVSEVGGGFGQISIASSTITVSIDIKPGNGSNTINSKSEGKLPVAILSNADFMAIERVDRESLKFGRTGEESSWEFCNKDSQDVNGDGLSDLVCHFSTQAADFSSTDTAGILTGQTTDGQRFMGKDYVRLVH